MCKLIQSHICSNRALKFLTLSLVHEAKVLSVLSFLLALLDLFFLGLWVLGAFALALVRWTSCGEFNPKQNANYLSVLVLGAARYLIT